MRVNKGQFVNVITMTIGGELIVEGRVEVIKAPKTPNDPALVRFPSGEVHSRWIDPSAQGDSINVALDYCRTLNKHLQRGVFELPDNAAIHACQPCRWRDEK